MAKPTRAESVRRGKYAAWVENGLCSFHRTEMQQGYSKRPKVAQVTPLSIVPFNKCRRRPISLKTAEMAISEIGSVVSPVTGRSPSELVIPLPRQERFRGPEDGVGLKWG